CAELVFYSVQVRNFLYMLYAVIYGYIGISIVVFDQIKRQEVLVYSYFILTSLLVIAAIFIMSRKFREDE
ncbi:MAG: hypothetical protein QMD11_12525, partial [Smithella sp.]|nr:hypothetical protein [Smithella sp.]